MPFRRITTFLILFALAALPTLPSRAAAARIVVLVPSFAQDVVALGARDELVGVSRFSADIPGVADIPVVADFQSVDSERIIALHPSVVAGIPSQARLLEPLRRAGIPVVLIPDDRYEDIFTDIRALGDLTHHAFQARRLIARLQRETATLHASVAGRKRHPTVFFALGTGPIWTAGPSSYIGRLIVLAGGRDAAANLRAPWGEYSEEALLRAQPDAIVAGEGTDLRAVATREPWRSLRAVREGHVFTISDPRIEAALFRPGPRYVEGLRWLIERLSSLSTPKTRSVRSNPNS